MARVSHLSEVEKGQILAFRQMNLSIRNIARRLKRSRDTISRCLKSSVLKQKRGRRVILSQKDKRRLIRLASNSTSSASNLKAVLGVKVSTRTIQRTLKSAAWLKYRKMRKCIALTQLQIERRLLWAEKHVSWIDQWSGVRFSDEKKFNLDGPDAWNYYWHDLRKTERVYHQRHNDRRSVMVWGAFSASGLSELVILDGNIDSHSYIRTLERFLLPLLTPNGHEMVIFQQDNAPMHTSNLTRSWLLFRGIKVMDWPACSPDLNPIENLWSVLARNVYKDAKVYGTTVELSAALKTEWARISPDVIQSLIGSMPRRCIEVLKRNGKSIPY